MHPFTVVLGVIAGSLFSLAAGLLVVLVVFFLLRNDNARFAFELPELIRSTGLFIVLSGLSATAFLGQLRERPWRYWPQLGLWLGLLFAAWYYWPS